MENSGQPPITDSSVTQQICDILTQLSRSKNSQASAKHDETNSKEQHGLSSEAKEVKHLPKKFSCDKCDKSYTRQGYLTRHQEEVQDVIFKYD